MIDNMKGQGSTDELEHGVSPASVVGHDHGLDALRLQQPRSHLSLKAVGKGFQNDSVVEVQ